MVDEELNPDLARIELGREVLARLDQLDVGIVGAAWIRDAESSNWVLELATPMLDSHGPAWIYRRLAPMVAKLPLPAGSGLLELRLASSQEATWRVVLHLFSLEDGVVQMIGNPVEGGTMLPDMVLYRARRATQTTAQQAEQFDRRYRELVSA